MLEIIKKSVYYLLLFLSGAVTMIAIQTMNYRMIASIVIIFSTMLYGNMIKNSK
ncbi:hypothetical protein IVR12_02276 (plasmid) [Limosilactobacillus reuteri]|nr:hypothetical protein IVR12_02276 [Limosilactobacillus reuteri]